MVQISTIAATPCLTPGAGLPLVLHTRVVSGAGGGPEKTILNSPRFLPPLGYRSVCAYMRPPGDKGFDAIRRRALGWSAEIVEIDDQGPFDRNVLRRLTAYCRENKVAIWHGHDYKSNLLGLLVRRTWPMKLVTTVHGWVKHTWKTPLYYAIDRLCLRWYDHIICVSPDLHETCLKGGVSSQRCSLIDNAIDTHEFQRSSNPSAAKCKLGFDPQRLLIGAVGRLSVEKGFDILIEAVKRLTNQLPVDLAIVGDGDQRQALQAIIERSGLHDRVKLLGFRADTINLYEAFDVFALSSYREGLPNVVLEAMAMETAVVSTRVAGVPRLITSGENGLLIGCGNVSELTQALLDLLKSADLRAELSHAARRTIEERFSFPQRMEKVARVYDNVLAT